MQNTNRFVCCHQTCTEQWFNLTRKSLPTAGNFKGAVFIEDDERTLMPVFLPHVAMRKWRNDWAHVIYNTGYTNKHRVCTAYSC